MPILICALRSSLLALTLASLAAPAFALSERDANAINQKLIKAQFIAGYARSGLQNLPDRPEAVACRDVRAAKSDIAAAANLSREALVLIGPDMMGEYKTQRDKLNSIVALDVDTDATLASCARDGL